MVASKDSFLAFSRPANLPCVRETKNHKRAVKLDINAGCCLSSSLTMVKSGPFTVQLIHAETGEAFPEHKAKNRRTYAEVEPGTEYKIQVKSSRVETARYYITLDGEDFGYYWTVKNGKEETEDDVQTEINGVVSRHTLQFAKPAPRGPNTEASWTGKLQVNFYREKILRKPRTVEREESEWTGGNVSQGQSESKSKGVRTVRGKVISKFPMKQFWRRTEECGRHLRTVTLHYCSTIGLIEAGILPRPPQSAMTWNLHRQMNPRSDDTGPTITPTLIQLAPLNSEHAQVVSTKAYELFDLVTDSDEDDSASEEAVEMDLVDESGGAKDTTGSVEAQHGGVESEANGSDDVKATEKAVKMEDTDEEYAPGSNAEEVEGGFEDIIVKKEDSE